MATLYYPAILTDKEQQVFHLRYIEDPGQARQRNRIGLRFIYSLEFTRDIKTIKKECKAAVSGHSASWLSIGMKAKAAEIKEMLSDFILDALFDTSSGELPDREQFQDTVKGLKKNGIIRQAREMINAILDLLATRRQVQVLLTDCRQRANKSRSTDIRRFTVFQQLLDELLPRDFLVSPRPDTLADKKRYLQALALRIERAEHAPSKDDRKQQRLQPALNRLQQISTRTGRSALCCREIDLYQRMIEEFRVSVFAPELGTAFPVSEKRLERQWQKLENSCRTME
jgi:ATP-dependent helicase HrpA